MSAKSSPAETNFRKHWWQLWRAKPKKELTEAEKQAQLETIHKKDRELLDKALAELEGPYGIYAQKQPLWDEEVTRTLHARWETEWRAREEVRKAGMQRGLAEKDIALPPWPQATRLDIEKEFAAKATNDLAALNAELGYSYPLQEVPLRSRGCRDQ